MAEASRIPDPPQTGCPADETLLRFLSGQLDLDAAPIERHLETCVSCLDRLPDLLARNRRRERPSAGWMLGAADEPRTVTTLIQRLCRHDPPTAGSGDTSGDAGPFASPPELAAPAQFGRYRVLRPLGAGGMGAVYLAEDPELNRLVAVKVPRFAGAPEAQTLARQRFLREARAAAAVRHPHVCPIYDVGEQDGTPYVVMAYIEGHSLADRLRREGPFADIRAAVALAIQIAEGLAAVHDRGLIHRDLKPSNILLDPSGSALLSDFGLARRQDEADRMTDSGALVGTLGYMAPEQVDAAAGFGPVTPRTDLFSLGVVLCEMLTGHLPFEAGSRAQLLYRIVHDAPTPPRQFRPDLDLRLESVLLRALAKNPAQRWPDCRAFVAVLGTGDQPAKARWSSPSRVWIGALLLALVVAGVGVFAVRQAIDRPRIDTAPDQANATAPPSSGQSGGSTPAPSPAPPASPRPAVATIEAHAEPVYAVALSPDGTRLATAGDDRSLRIWNVATGKRTERMAHEVAICCLAFSPDGTTLASGDTAGTVWLWDATTWQKTKSIANASRTALARIAFAPDGNKLVTVGHRQKAAIVWDANTLKQAAALDGHADHVNAAAFSPDSRLVATASDDRTVRLWDAATGQPRSPLRAHDRPVTCVAFSPDGTKLATGGEDQTIVVWDVATGTVIKPELQDDGPVVFVGWTPDSRIVAKTYRDGVKLWSRAGVEPVTIRRKFTAPLVAIRDLYRPQVALAPDGRVLAFRDCHATHHVHLLDLRQYIDLPK